MEVFRFCDWINAAGNKNCEIIVIRTNYFNEFTQKNVYVSKIKMNIMNISETVIDEIRNLLAKG